MMGSGQLTSKSKEQRGEKKEAAGSHLYDSPILPNRRLIANLELEIAHVRDLVARGIVPKGSGFPGLFEFVMWSLCFYAI